MIFLQILQTFYDYALAVIPLFLVGSALAVVALEYFPARTLDRIIKDNVKREVLAAAFFGVLFPATPGLRVPMAAIARRGGAAWTPVLTFVGAGAGAGISTILITTMIGWQVAVLRLIIALWFALMLALVVSRFVEPRFAATAMDADVEPLFARDFCEATADEIDRAGGELTLLSVWRRFGRLVRVTLPWLALSVFLAALVATVVPEGAIALLVTGRFGAAKAALLGIPFYLVGGADIPLLFILLRKGMGMGAAASLMLAAPLVNIPMLSALGRWLGYRKALGFLIMCWLIAAVIGSALGFFSS